MGELFNALTLKDIGATALVVIVVLMIFRGTLIPLRFYDQMVDTYEKMLASEREAKDNYKAASEDLLTQNSMLLKRDDLATHTLTEIKSYVKEARATEGGETT